MAAVFCHFTAPYWRFACRLSYYGIIHHPEPEACRAEVCVDSWFAAGYSSKGRNEIYFERAPLWWSTVYSMINPNPLPHIPCSPSLLLSVSRFLPCRLADATVMWSTLRCSSHYSLMALLTPSLRRKWERVGSMVGGAQEKQKCWKREGLSRTEDKGGVW